jgi:hypothetical protein
MSPVPRIFISHASKDEPLSNERVDSLQTGRNAAFEEKHNFPSKDFWSAFIVHV